MNTMVISEDSFEAVWVERPRAVGRSASFELVKAFGDRIYSIAKHITQDDNDAGAVLIETFLVAYSDEVGSDSDGCQANERVWLQLVTIAVREAFSILRNRGEDCRLLDGVADPYEDLVVRELFVWGDDYQQRYTRERTTRILEHGLRSLDPMCRTIFVLRDIEEVSVEHIAKMLNRSSAAVEVCLLRARLQLREMLTRQMRQRP